MYIFISNVNSNKTGLDEKISRIDRGFWYSYELLDKFERSKLRANPAYSVFGFSEKDYDSWEMVEEGDLMLFRDGNQIVGIGKVILKKESESLSRIIWKDQREIGIYIVITSQAYSTVYGIKELEEITHQKITDDELQYLHDESYERMLKHFVSIQGFVNQITGTVCPIFKETDEIEAIQSSEQIEKVSTSKNRPGSLTDTQVAEMQRIAGLFDNVSPKDLTYLDEITRDKDLEAVVKEYSNRNSSRKPEVINLQIRKIKRDISLVRSLKKLYRDKCQICGFQLLTPTGQYYSEAAHISPISTLSKGVDTAGNILILCPNHHKMLDYGALEIVSRTECIIAGKKHPIKVIEFEKIQPKVRKQIEKEYHTITNRFSNGFNTIDKSLPLEMQKKIKRAQDRLSRNI